MNNPFTDPSARPHRANVLHDPRRRNLLLIGLAVLLTVIVALAWNASGSRDARRDLRTATSRIYDARNNVEEARQVLEQRLAELREAEAAAVAESERLDAEIVRERRGEAAGTLAPPLNEEQRAAETLRRTDEQLRAGNPPRRP